MLVKALLEGKDKKDIITAKVSTTIDEAMGLLIDNNIGCLPIMEKSRLIGIVSDKDIFKKVYHTKGDYHTLTLEHVMSTKLIVGVPDDEIAYISGVMNKNWIRHIPIVEGEKLVGLVSLMDINRIQAENRDFDNRYLQAHLDGIHMRDKSADF